MYLHILLSNGTWTLTTLVLTRKTMNNYALTTKILQEATKQEHDFKPILRTRNRAPGKLVGEETHGFSFYSGFEVLTTKPQNSRKTTNNHKQTQNTL